MSESKPSAPPLKPADWAKNLPRPAYKNLERVITSEDWFSVYKTHENTYTIYEDGQYEEAISYLVIGRKSALLLDAGNGIADIRSLCRELTDLPVAHALTHSHIDHVGSSYLFDDIAAFDDAHGFARRNAALGFFHEKAKNYIGHPVVVKPYPAYFDPNTYCIPPYRVTRWLKDGDRFDLGGRTLEVIHTPGHSPDSICFLDATARLLFLGDIFYTGSIYAWADDGANIDRMAASYEKVLARSSEYDTVMPSHNEPAIEKEMLEKAYAAFVEIKNGGGNPVVLSNGKKKYDYGRFAFVIG